MSRTWSHGQPSLLWWQVVALFNLYMEGAKSAADSKQQVGAGVCLRDENGSANMMRCNGGGCCSLCWLVFQCLLAFRCTAAGFVSYSQALANNLLGRAVQLSRHTALGPDATVCCALAVAELQLQQAKAMLAKGGTMCSLAVALLSTSYQQLTGGDLQAAAAASSAARVAGLLDAKKQVGRRGKNAPLPPLWCLTSRRPAHLTPPAHALPACGPVLHRCCCSCAVHTWPAATPSRPAACWTRWNH